MLGEAADFFSERLAVAPVLAVLRGHDPHSSVQVAEVCWNAGVELVEVSLSHDRALEAVTAVCRRAAELGRVAGAETVCTAGEVRAAAETGASFVVTPGLARDAVEAARHGESSLSSGSRDALGDASGARARLPHAQALPST
jgi:2-keto-3-deoxy-6-phosphogluconate aldolase